MSNPFQAFRDAVERHDVDAAVGLFSPEVVFHSPVVRILAGHDGVRTELTVMVRPYSAATLLRERMAALLS